MIMSTGLKPVSRRHFWITAMILVLAVTYFYQDPEWNGNSRLDLTRAIVERGSLWIDGFESQANWETGDKALYAGHYYSDKGIGSSLLALPFYLILYRLSTGLGVALASSITKHILTALVIGGAFTAGGLAAYLIAFQITQSASQAMVSTLAVCLGTMLWPYGAVFYGHVVAAALLILAFYFVFSVRGTPEAFTHGRAFCTGLALGLAFITEYPTALIIIALVVYSAYALRTLQFSTGLRIAMTMALGAMIPLSVLFAYNFQAFGTLLTTGYSFEVESRFQEGMGQGLYGLHLPDISSVYHITFDPQFGLFWQSPVLLLSAAGFYVALRGRQYRAEALLCLYAIASMIAMNGGYYLWWGGSAFGPRLLIPALPFFIVPLAALPRRTLWITGLLGLVSAANMLIPLTGQIQITRLVFRLHRGMFYVADAPFRGFSLLYNYGVPHILRQYSAGTPAWTLGAAVGLPNWISVPALIVVEIALILFHLRTGRSQA
jgi:hypothetical protein